MVCTQAEMRFYNGTELDDAYKIYGVGRERGAVAAVRPDGYIGVVASLNDMGRVEAYLKGCLRTVEKGTNGI